MLMRQLMLAAVNNLRPLGCVWQVEGWPLVGGMQHHQGGITGGEEHRAPRSRRLVDTGP